MIWKTIWLRWQVVFNQFFVNVSPELATNIPNPGPSGVHMDKLIDRIPHSMFLKAVEENEIINIVKKV